MKTANALLPAALLALALVACQPASDSNNVAIDGTNATVPPDVAVLPPSEDAAAAEPSAADSIPSQYRGRWGIVPADCTSTRGDAKGLITIAEGTIRFYESTATLKEQRPAIATSFSGQFDFTGEGQTWQRVMTFTRTGDTLKRADDEGNISYKRCG